MIIFMKQRYILPLLWILFVNCSISSQKTFPPQPLRHAHAHNDYDHDRPLFDALEYGFTSIEADVILRNDTLYVAHDPEDIRPDRTLQSLYLDALFNLQHKHGGTVYPNWPTVYLMIDFKSDADSTYKRLRSIITNYSTMLTSWQNDKKIERAVTIIVSGNRPIEKVKAEQTRFVGIDGRFQNLTKNPSKHVFPWISENWTDHFEWRGIDEIPKHERDKLVSIVQQTHDNGQLIRFWATDSPSPSARQKVWRTLLAAGVDLINTDDLEGFSNYLYQR